MMEVKIGWSKEVEDSEWTRIDVAVDEVDLNSMFVDAELGELVGLPINAGLKFLLLKVEAERLILSHVRTSGYLSDAEFQVQAKDLLVKKEQVLEAVRKKYKVDRV
jgi:hypothetical protein